MPLIFEFRKQGTVKKMPSIRMVLLHENGLEENLKHREQVSKITLYKSEGKKFQVKYKYLYYNKEKDDFELIENSVAFKDKNKYIKFIPKIIHNNPDREVLAENIKDLQWKIYCLGFD